MYKFLIIFLFILILSGCSYNFNLGSELAINDIQENIYFGEKYELIAFSDDNTNEDIIIKTDTHDYIGFGGDAMMFLSVTNLGNSQNIIISYARKDLVRNVERFDGNNITTIQKEVYISSSSKDTEIIKTEVVIAEWTNMSIFKPKISKQVTRKNTNSLPVNYAFSDNFNFNETKFYRAVISIPKNDKSEWFIEAFGSEGSYGHLDPNNWTYEDDFDDYSTGDLNGQGSWSGDTEFDVADSGITAANGSQFVQAQANASVAKVIEKDFGSTVVSGTVYLSMRKNNNADGRMTYYGKAVGSANSWTIDMHTDGNIRAYDPAVFDTIDTYSADTWYRIGVAFECGAGEYEGLSADTYKVNVDNGSWSDAKAFETAADGIDGLKFGSIKDATSNYYYWDYIDPDYEEAADETAAPKGSFIMFD